MSRLNRPTLVNELKIKLPALSVNESAARSIVAAFVAQLNPTVSEVADIKCVVSEAVTNCIVHAYPEKSGVIYIAVQIYNNRSVRLEIRDRGIGIADVKQARQPLFTTSPETERSGMGFTVMESFTDKMRVRSKVGKGTSVLLIKQLEDFSLFGR
ncbi:MAG: anti-sigma F factor [Clostridia bacterium]|nr:anti-sigma F factor [Clostridia bacterium]MBQ2376972.1 anti-sigma F factor [Clostridia bacterium]